MEEKSTYINNVIDSLKSAYSNVKKHAATYLFIGGLGAVTLLGGCATMSSSDYNDVGRSAVTGAVIGGAVSGSWEGAGKGAVIGGGLELLFKNLFGN